MVNASDRLLHLWGRLRGTDPYWDNFLHRPPADPRNIITPVLLAAPTGSVFPQQTEIHDPGATSGHIRELAAFFGADVTGIAAFGTVGVPAEVAIAGDDRFTAVIVSLVAAIEEVREGTGIGGQFAFQKSAVVNFNTAAYIRELGYRAVVNADNAEAYAAAAGLGELDSGGRLRARRFGRSFGLSGVVLTDLPLTPDAGR